MNHSPIICLMGPTAAGKSAVAMYVAQHMAVEIISVDSAQIYRGMNIGTAKPSLAEQRLVPHHLINICDPSRSYSVGQFCEDATRCIADIQSRGRTVLLVGGTMMYFSALQHGINDLPQSNDLVRRAITKQALDCGWPKLHEQLVEIDSALAEKIHPNDSQRIQRALEIYQLTGAAPSLLFEKTKQVSDYDFVNIGIIPNDRAILHQHIEERFLKMIENGLLNEVNTLYDRGDLSLDLSSIRTVGYKQLWLYLQGEYDWDTAIYKAVVATRQLAKRQLTWLRRWENITCFDSLDQSYLNQIKSYINTCCDYELM